MAGLTGKGFFVAAATLAVLAVSSCAVSRDQAPQQVRTVTVTQTGSVDLLNDQATIVLAVTTRNTDVLAATQENADKMTAVRDAVIEAGTPKENISTSNYWIHSEETQSGRATVVQYVVTNQVQILVTDIKKTGSVIDSALKAGANQLSSVTFSNSDTEQAIKQARLLAIQRAQETANTIATASGFALGKAVTMHEVSTPAYYAVPAEAAMSRNAFNNTVTSATPVSAGTTTVSVMVEATYEME